ncbi:MAG: hypothetical protein GY866_26710 [Proteobacteria bacterium]|nr:hypothetical protein [Pseudomonadota bacterium]
MRVRKTRNSVTDEKIFELAFTEKTLDRKLDAISLDVGRWIKPEFAIRKTVSFPSLHLPDIKDVFRYRRIMFGAHEIPEIRLTLHLLDRLTVRSPPETIADLAEGMIVLSQKLEGEETTSLLDRTESLLRKAIIEHKNSPRLYALLAEVYYFQHSATPWIERTAEEALKLDPQNDLACILLALIRDVDLDGEREHLGRLKAINPWLFMDDPNSAVRFQKGILMSEVHALKSQE